MDYRKATELLYEQLPIYQRQGQLAYKPDLGNIEALCEHYGNPQNSFPSVHIAGTNGKGSTAHIMASVLQEAGYRVGLHTQPHFLDLRERIRVNGEICPKNFITQETEDYWNTGAGIAPSFFELMVAWAFRYFESKKVDVAIVETGLGGRLDATNILKPELTAITNIGHDHMHLLGEDLPSIAKEKAGIIKERTPLILGDIPEEARTVIEEKAREQEAPIHWSSSWKGAIPDSDLKGPFQEANIRTALTAFEALKGKGWRISGEAREGGLRKVTLNTGMMGRWQILQKEPLVVADMGHNREAIDAVRETLDREDYRKLHWVFGSVDDKEWDETLRKVPENCSFYPCQADVPRAMPIETLRDKLAEHGFPTASYGSVKDAYEAARGEADEEDIILIGGSAFVVAEFLEGTEDLGAE
jgi:dihydrofolate synthase/folylpolyglutamate synthase